jgi:hypothetical protein
MQKSGKPVQENGRDLAIVLTTLVGATILISRCSDTTTSSSIEPAANAMDSDLVNEISTPLSVASKQAPKPDPAASRRAAVHLRLSLDAEGFSGAMVYSQNCYASLERKFSWRKLDQCAAYDTLVQVGATSAPDLSSGEGEYFSKANVRQRFDLAASGDGTDASSIEEHFTVLQSAALARLPDLQVAAEQSSPDAAEQAETTDAPPADDHWAPSLLDTDTENELDGIAEEEIHLVHACASGPKTPVAAGILLKGRTNQNGLVARLRRTLGFAGRRSVRIESIVEEGDEMDVIMRA